MHCRLSNYSLCTQFVDGLKPNVQMHMLHDCPDNLDQLYHLAIDIDGQLYKMKKHLQDFQKQGFTFSNPESMPNSASASTPAQFNPIPNPDPDAMEIDVYSVLGSDGRLNNAEKTHQK